MLIIWKFFLFIYINLNKKTQIMSKLKKKKVSFILEIIIIINNKIFFLKIVLII